MAQDVKPSVGVKVVQLRRVDEIRSRVIRPTWPDRRRHRVWAVAA